MVKCFLLLNNIRFFKLTQFSALVASSALLVACGGGGDSTATSTAPPAGNGSATVANNVLQYAVQTPLSVTLKDTAGAVVSGTLNCVSPDTSALEVAADCSTAKAKRLGSYAVSVSGGSIATTFTLRNIPQRQALPEAPNGGDQGLFAALPADGSPWFWGSNSNGGLAQLVNYLVLGNSGLPLRGKVSATQTMQGIAALAIGNQTSLALTEHGEVLSWGGNNHDTLGRTAPNGDVIPANVRNAADTGNLTGIVQIGSGDWNAAALSDDGYVYAWGWGYTVGSGKKDNAPRPNRVQLPDGSPLSNVVQVSVGRLFALALTQSGTVYGWGWNATDATGTGQPTTSGNDYVFYAYPVIDASSRQPLSGITSVSAGYAHALALASAGQVYSWGENSSGQLGNGTALYKQGLATLVNGVGGTGTLSNIKAISAGGLHSLALDASGQVLAWGQNNAQLGQGIGSGVGNQRLYPGYVVDVAGTANLQGVVSIAGTSNNSYALTTDGSVLAWGNNFYNQLGQNNDTTSISTNTLLESLTPRKVKDAAGTGTLSLGALTEFKNLSRRYR